MAGAYKLSYSGGGHTLYIGNPNPYPCAVYVQMGCNPSGITFTVDYNAIATYGIFPDVMFLSGYDGIGTGFLKTDILAEVSNAEMNSRVKAYFQWIWDTYHPTPGFEYQLLEGVLPPPVVQATKISTSGGNIILDGSGYLIKGIPAGDGPIEHPLVPTIPINAYAFSYAQSGQQLYRVGGYGSDKAQALFMPAHEMGVQITLPYYSAWWSRLLYGGSSYVYGGKVYTRGGLSWQAGFGVLYELDPVTNTITQLAPPNSYGGFGCFQAPTSPILEKDGLHYAFTIGGIYVSNNGNSENNTHIRTCMETGAVEFASTVPSIIAPLPYTQPGRAMLSAVQTSPTTYIAIGGVAYWNAGAAYAAYSDVIKYDITTNAFTTLAPLPSVCGGGGAVLYNNKIYCVAGFGAGFTANTNVYCYDIAGNSWSTLTAMPNASRYSFSMGLYDGKIYILDGYNTTGASTVNNTTRPMDIYDIATDTWSTQAITFAG